jgi:3-oxoadipate enol-lactonase
LTFYQSGDARLYFHALGMGPDLVLLHPTPVHHGFWLPVAMQLSDRFRVTLPDLRGHGRSDSGQGMISVERLAEDIGRMLDAAGIETAFFAGCSVGSYTLFELWRRMPHRIRGLAFCCGKPHPDSLAGRETRTANIEKLRQGGRDPFLNSMAETLVGASARVRNPELVLELRAMMDPMTAETLIAVQQGLGARPDSIPTLPTITVPILALAGGEDGFSTPEQMEVIHSQVPGSLFQILPDAGHYAPYEQPEAVAGLIRKVFN